MPISEMAVFTCSTAQDDGVSEALAITTLAVIIAKHSATARTFLIF